MPLFVFYFVAFLMKPAQRRVQGIVGTWDFVLRERNPAVSDGVDQILKLGRNLGLLPALVVQEEAARQTNIVRRRINMFVNIQQRSE